MSAVRRVRVVMTRQHVNKLKYVRGHKNKKILLYFGMNKVTSTKYFMDSTWYLTISK